MYVTQAAPQLTPDWLRYCSGLNAESTLSNAYASVASLPMYWLYLCVLSHLFGILIGDEFQYVCLCQWFMESLFLFQHLQLKKPLHFKAATFITSNTTHLMSSLDICDPPKVPNNSSNSPSYLNLPTTCKSHTSDIDELGIATGKHCDTVTQKLSEEVMPPEFQLFHWNLNLAWDRGGNEYESKCYLSWRGKNIMWTHM